jgi:hypothetical protein
MVGSSREKLRPNEFSALVVVSVTKPLLDLREIHVERPVTDQDWPFGVDSVTYIALSHDDP